MSLTKKDLAKYIDVIPINKIYRYQLLSRKDHSQLASIAFYHRYDENSATKSFEMMALRKAFKRQMNSIMDERLYYAHIESVLSTSVNHLQTFILELKIISQVFSFPSKVQGMLKEEIEQNYRKALHSLIHHQSFSDLELTSFLKQSFEVNLNKLKSEKLRCFFEQYIPNNFPHLAPLIEKITSNINLLFPVFPGLSEIKECSFNDYSVEEKMVVSEILMYQFTLYFQKEQLIQSIFNALTNTGISDAIIAKQVVQFDKIIRCKTHNVAGAWYEKFL